MSFKDTNVLVCGARNYLDGHTLYTTVIPKPTMDDNRIVLTQDMMSKKNTKYIIKWNFVLGEDITVPKNCLIEFDGGSISNDNGENFSLTGQDTYLLFALPIEEVLMVPLLGTFIYGVDNEKLDNTDGMAKIYLKRDKSLAEQIDAHHGGKPNTIYVIQYDFTLGEDITVPANCVLEFEGGSIDGGGTAGSGNGHTVTFNNTIVTKQKNAFTNCRFAGSIDTQILNISWFGVHADGQIDDSYIINDILQCVDGKGCTVNFDCNNDYALGDATDSTTVHIPNNVNINFTGDGFLKLMSPSDGGQVVLIMGVDDVTIKNIRIDGGGTAIIVGASGQNGIGMGQCHNILIQGGHIKNCARGIDEGATWGGKAIQIENQDVESCFISDLFIEDCFRALSTNKDGGNTSGITVQFNNIYAKNCEQFFFVQQTNVNDSTAMHHVVTLDNFVVENCGSFDGVFVFSRARNIQISNGIIRGTENVNTIFSGRFALTLINNIQINQSCESIVNLIPTLYAPDTSESGGNYINVSINANYDYIIKTDTSANKALFNSTFILFDVNEAQNKTIVNGSVFSSGQVYLDWNFANKKIYKGNGSGFLVDFAANPNNLPDYPLFYSTGPWVTSEQRPNSPIKGTLVFDETLRRLVCFNGSGWIPADEYSPGGAIASFGTSAQRPEAPSISDGQTIYETDTKRRILWNGAQWVGLDGLSLDHFIDHSSQRPTVNIRIGYMCFDAEIGKPIWVKSIDESTNPITITWVDATGAAV